MAKKKSTAHAVQDTPKVNKEKGAFKVITDNRRARHEYLVVDSLEAGIELAGTEVKAMRYGKANLQDAFARVENGEVWMYNCHISPYEFGNRFNHDPDRKRRLLLHKSEIRKLKQKVQEKGLTLIPLKMYFKGNWAKVDLGLCKGKRLYDKREAISKREIERQVERAIKGRY